MGPTGVLKKLASTKAQITFSWNSAIQESCKQGSPEKAFSLFVKMVEEGKETNFFTYPSLLSACSKLETPSQGKQVHAHSLKLGMNSDKFLRSSLVHMYSSFGDMASAQTLFDEMPESENIVVSTALINGYAKQGDMEKAMEVFELLPERDLVTWSAVVAGHVQLGRFAIGLELFKKMILDKAEPTEGAIVCALSACASLGALQLGRSVHAQLLRKKGNAMGVNQGTALVDMYGKCGAMAPAMAVFEAMVNRNLWTWNAAVGGFAAQGDGSGALAVLGAMLKSGFYPDHVTFLGLLGAFSHGGMVEQGREFFRWMKRSLLLEPRLEHYACMVDLLARGGLLEEAEEVVREMPIEPDPGVWGALLGGCRVHGDVRRGVAVGRRLLRSDPGGAGRYAVLSSMYAAAKQWEEARSVRWLMAVRGVRAQTGVSSVEVCGAARELAAGG